jgi:hypothetical protein
MWLIYGFLICLAVFVAYRLVQWHLFVVQFRAEGRDIRAEMERMAALEWEQK